jgi:hypothetical protein
MAQGDSSKLHGMMLVPNTSIYCTYITTRQFIRDFLSERQYSHLLFHRRHDFHHN